MITIAAEEIQAEDVALLSMDGDDVSTELICSSCARGLGYPTDDTVTTTRAGRPFETVIGNHRRVYQDRGWRRVDGVVMCPRCVTRACEECSADDAD
ncbi:MAG: hypothetical protein ACYTHJ_09870 [Planctomycetota bacterium]|jgi:hypothetical protein